MYYSFSDVEVSENDLNMIQKSRDKNRKSKLKFKILFILKSIVT